MLRTKNHKILNYEVRWKNFRCFRDTGWLTIRPLTVLIGPNNSGKTSVIAPLLLLTQTMLCRDPVAPLVMRGPLVDAGTFQNIVFNHKTSLDIYFGMRFHTHDPHRSIKKIGEYPPGVIELIFAKGKTPQVCVLKSYALQDTFKRPFLRRTRLSSGNYSLKGIQIQKLQAAERRALRRSQPVNFLFSPTRDLRSLAKPDAIQKSRLSDEFLLYLDIIGFVFDDLRSIFNKLFYIGPLRERPKRFYEVLGEALGTVGPTGERAPNLLHSRYKRFRQKVNRWVRTFEMGQELLLKDLSDDLFEINFKSKLSKSITNIANSGFGASQVLPLITQAIAAAPDSLTLAEQPEIHLNPRLQCILADLFVEMAATNHRIIVETHSEHLLLRLRRLVAIGKISHEDVALYFVERDGEQSTIRHVPIQKNGHIEPADWPGGFFGDTLRESLALATAQSSK